MLHRTLYTLCMQDGLVAGEARWQEQAGSLHNSRNIHIQVAPALCNVDIYSMHVAAANITAMARPILQSASALLKLHSPSCRRCLLLQIVQVYRRDRLCAAQHG